jgi:hypothetical protein
MLAVQRYLINGKSLTDLKAEYGIEVTEHPTEPLVILNYNQIESPKNEIIAQECRALTLEKDTWNVVARSFTRFFNYGEMVDLTSKFNWNKFEVTSKEDGSLMVMYNYKGTWRVNTRGSFAKGNVCDGGPTWENLFFDALGGVKVANELLSPQSSFVFELCSPWNKVVRQYTKPTLFLLTIFNKDLDATFEGVVCRDNTNMRIKVKNARYISLHTLKGNNNIFLNKNLVPFVLAGEGSELLTYFPEVRQKYERIETIINNAKSELVRIWDEAKYIENQKDFAQFILPKTRLSSILFEARKLKKHPLDVWKESPERALSFVESNIKETV